MLLRVRTENGDFSLEERSNFNIVYGYEGEQTLSFDISVMDKNYRNLRTRGKLLYGSNRYNIQKINKRKTISTIIAELDMNEWKQRIHREFEKKDVLFTDIMLEILPDGWYLENAGAAKGRGTLSMQGVNDYEILMECKNVFHIVYEYHIEDRCIKVLDPSTVQQRGLYLSDELNLNSVEYKGDFTNQVNRLYAYGKKTEITREDDTTEISYVTFASINDGKEYVDCMDYMEGEIVCAYWQDDKITDSMELLREAKAKIKELAAPDQSWSCNIYDLSRTNEKYRHLDFHLYDKPTLLCDGQSIVHQIVEYTEYPDNENLNKVVLSTTFQKIEGVVSTIKTDVNKINQDLTVKERVLNELTRDVNNNTLRIENTFTKKEIETIQETILQQTNESITASIKEVDKKIDQIDIKAIQLLMVKEGTLLSQEVSSIVLQAQISENAQDITDTIPEIAFTWQRKSKDATADAAWNEAHRHLKSITITHDDVFQSASFQVSVTTASYTKVSGYETITDETDIPKLSLYLDSNLPDFQHYDTKTKSISPSWNPLVITPEVKDGVMQVQLSACEIIWRRSDGALQEGEEVVDGALKVSQNKLSESTDKVITYLCSVRYKDYQVMAQKSYALIIDGNDGADGKDGKDGVSIQSTIVTYQASTSGTSVPTGTWSTTIPSVSANQYLWTRTVITMTDSTSTTSYTIGKIGANGTNGKDGADGKNGTDGKGIKSTVVTYQASASGTTTPTGTWSNTIPSVASNQFLWTRTIITYTDNTSSTSYSIGKMGAQGAKGDTGATGNGIASVIAEYYLSTSKTTQAGGSWVTTAPTWSSGKYMWTRTKVTYTSGTINYTAPVCDSSWEAANEVEDKVNDKIKNDVGDVETRITETFNSSLNMTKNEIVLSVEEIKKSATEALEIIESVKTSVNQSSTGVTILTEAQEQLTKLLNNNIEDVKEIKKWVEIGNGSIKIGRTGSAFSMILNEEKLTFYQSENAIAWISNNELHIAHAVVMESIKIGSFQFDYQPNVGLVLKKWK